MSLVHTRCRSALPLITCLTLLACSGAPAQPRSPSSPRKSSTTQSPTEYPANQEAVLLNQRNDGPPFQFLLKQGPNAVGLKVVAQFDRTRPYPGPTKDASKFPAGENARPLQTLIWYPAVRGATKPMTIGDYVALADTEIQFNTPDEKTNKWRSRLKHLPTIPMWAARDANAAQGSYPVVIYAPSGSSVAWENPDLCEYLASSGYVVLASRSMGASTRDMPEDLEGINSQARDISFLITYAGTLPNADLSRVAVVSFSWGGISSLFAAARDPRIAALAQL